MKKYLIVFILSFLSFTGVAHALTTIRYEQNVAPFVTNSVDNGTSTNIWKNLWTNGLHMPSESDGCAQFTSGALSSSGTPCGTGGGGGGSDGNWLFFGNSGIRLATTSNQVIIGATATSTLSNPFAKLHVTGDTSFVGNSTTTGVLTSYKEVRSPFFTATSTATSTFPTASITGRLYDTNGTGGTNGFVLQTTGSGVTWVSTTTLGFQSGGITSLNGLTGATQTFASTTSGTDFSVTSSGTTHTFATPSASATNRGFLTSTDWSTFNNKVAATRALTVAGTASQITSSAGSQDLSSDRTWTLSLPSHVIFPNSFKAISASTTNATSTHQAITGLFTFGGVTGDTWDDFCTTITGSSSLCDGSDATGAGGGSGTVATSSNETANYVPYWTSTAGTPALLGSDSGMQYNAASDILTILNASSTRLSALQGAAFGATATSSFSSTGVLTLASALTVPNGGTGQTTFTAGDMIFATTPTTLTRLASSTGGTVLMTSTSTGAPSWVSTSTLGISGGGSGSGTVASGLQGQSAFYNAGGTTVSGTSTLFIAQSQKVGIGTTTPAAFVDIQTGTSSMALRVSSSTGSTMFEVEQNGNIGVASSTAWGLFSINPTGIPGPSFVVGSSTKTDFVVTNAGLIGIGTTSPYARLSVVGESMASFFTATSTTATSTINGILAVGSSTDPQISMNPNGQAMFALGATSSPFAKFTIHTTKTDTLLNLVAVASSTQTSTTTHFLITNTGAIYAPNTTGAAGAQTGYWCYDTNGQFIRDSAVCLVSAKKYKKDIHNLSLGLDELMKMRPVTYYKKDPLDKQDSYMQMGFIADEVADIPELDEMLVVRDSKGEIRGFRYDQYAALTTKAIQDLNNKTNSTNYWPLLGLLGLLGLRKKK